MLSVPASTASSVAIFHEIDAFAREKGFSIFPGLATHLLHSELNNDGGGHAHQPPGGAVPDIKYGSAPLPRHLTVRLFGWHGNSGTTGCRQSALLK